MTGTVEDSGWTSGSNLLASSAAGAELLLLLLYGGRDDGYHWLVHLFSGATVGLLAATMLVLLRSGAVSQPATAALIAVVAGHLIASVPDLLFVLGTPHSRWMDLLIAHLSVHNAPGGTWALLAVMLATLAGYLAATVRHRCRTTAA